MIISKMGVKGQSKGTKIHEQNDAQFNKVYKYQFNLKMNLFVKISLGTTLNAAKVFVKGWLCRGL